MTQSDVEHLVHALTVAVEKAVLSAAGPTIPIAFSGGLDSAIVAALARRACAAQKEAKPYHIILYAVGFDGAHDLLNAAHAAQAIAALRGFKRTSTVTFRQILVTDAEVEAVLSPVVRAISSPNPVHVAISIPFYLMAQTLRDEYQDVPTMLCGQGADELFGGYARYLDMDAASCSEAMRADTEAFMGEGIGRYDALLRPFNLSLAYPYLDDAVVSYAEALPLSRKIRGGERKIILRDVAKALMLDEAIAGQKKKAMQYGSGIMNSMKRIARTHTLTVAKHLKGME